MNRDLAEMLKVQIITVEVEKGFLTLNLSINLFLMQALASDFLQIAERCFNNAEVKFTSLDCLNANIG